MMNHQDGQNSSRIRHVPIHIERRGDQARDIYSDQQQRQQHRGNQPIQHPINVSSPSYTFFQHYRDDRPDRNASNTSNVDINYESPDQRTRQQQHSHQHKQHQGADSNFSTDQSSPMEGVQNDNQANQNKENNDVKNPRGGSHVKQPDSEPASQKPSSVIPLPPPPEQPRPPKNERRSPPKQQQAEQTEQYEKEDPHNLHQHQQESQQKQQSQHEEQQTQQEDIEASKKVKKDSGPEGVIEATREEVNNLLREIASCNETFQDSKEYRRLDELLTRCVLRLDTIDCSNMPELRPKRKAIIAMIDKCTDILKRKVSLNHDIQQMMTKAS